MDQSISKYANILKHRHEPEWYEKAIKEITRLDPEWRKAHASPVPSGVKLSISVPHEIHEFEDFIKYLEENENRCPTFSEFVVNAIKERGMENKEFYIAAKMDRKLFSAIKNNVDYKPKKETAVACCFALKLSLDDAKLLLECAGYSLSMAIQWDRVVYYCLREGITDLSDVNELLYELDEKLIRQ